MIALIVQKIVMAVLQVSLWLQNLVPIYHRLYTRVTRFVTWPLHHPFKLLCFFVGFYRYQNFLARMGRNFTGFTYGLSLDKLTQECDGALFYVTPDRLHVRHFCIGVRAGMDARQTMFDAVANIRDTLLGLLILWLVFALFREKVRVQDLRKSCSGKDASAAKAQASLSSTEQEHRTLKKEYARLKTASAESLRALEKRTAGMQDNYNLATTRRVREAQEMERHLKEEIYLLQDRNLAIQVKYENAAALDKKRVANQHQRELAAEKQAFAEYKHRIEGTELGAQCLHLERKVAALSRDKEGARVAAHAAEEVQKGLEEEVRSLCRDLKTKEATNCQLEEMNASAEQRHQDLLARLETAKKQLETSQSQLVASTMARADLEREKVLLVGNTTQLEAELQNARSEQDAARSKAASLESQLASVKVLVCQKDRALKKAQEELAAVTATANAATAALRAQRSDDEDGDEPESKRICVSKERSEPAAHLAQMSKGKPSNPAEAPTATTPPASKPVPAPAPGSSSNRSVAASVPGGTEEAWKRDPNSLFQLMYRLGYELHENCVAWTQTGQVGSIVALYDLRARIEKLCLAWDGIRKSIGKDVLADVTQKSFLHTVLLSVSLTHAWEKSDKSGLVDASRILVEKCLELGLAMDPAHKGYL